jgi:hypothetical protein
VALARPHLIRAMRLSCTPAGKGVHVVRGLEWGLLPALVGNDMASPTGIALLGLTAETAKMRWTLPHPA